MNKKMIALVVFIVGVGVVVSGVMINNLNKEEVNPPAGQETQQAQDGITEPEVVTFTSAEIAVHDNRDDCWMSIGGMVYDVTNYIVVHPGREEILRGCGIDATSLFTQRTTEGGETVGSGTPHSNNAYSQLGQYFIGSLAN